MNKKHLYFALTLFVLALIALSAAFVFTDFKYPVQSQGQLVFSQSYEQGVDIDKIILTNRQEKITLQLKDNLWRVAENSDYYAGTQLLNLLLTDLNTSVLFSRQENSPQHEQNMGVQTPSPDNADSGVLVQTYAKDKLLDSVIIGKTSKNNLYHYAKLANGELWQVSGIFELPLDSYSWLLQPILELPPSMVEQIRFSENGQSVTVSRSNENSYFRDNEDRVYKAQPLLTQLSSLVAIAAKDKQTFPQDALILSRRLEVITFAGLALYFDFYEDKDKSIWIQLTLSTTALPMTVVHDYIKDNKFLYDGWFFKLSSQAQKTLIPASLI